MFFALYIKLHSLEHKRRHLIVKKSRQNTLAGNEENQEMITWGVWVATAAKQGNNVRAGTFRVANIELKGLILSTPLVTFEGNNGDAKASSIRERCIQI